MNSQKASILSRCLRLVQKGGTVANVGKGCFCSLAPTVFTITTNFTKFNSLKTGSLKLKLKLWNRSAISGTNRSILQLQGLGDPADSTLQAAPSKSFSISIKRMQDDAELLSNLDTCRSTPQATSTLREKLNMTCHSTSTSQDDRFVVCVEGNIGCGKTTLLNYFENIPDCEVNIEPVEKWRSVGGANPLALMYNDPARWALALQTYIQLTMLQIHTKPMNSKVRLMERSIFSAKYVFVDNLYRSGTMHEMEYIILTKWFDWIVSTHDVKVDLIVYLRTDPLHLNERILARNRAEEKNIPLEYLQALHQSHDDWLVHKKSPCPADVLVLDANSNLEQMKLVYEQYKSNILNARLQEAQNG